MQAIQSYPKATLAREKRSKEQLDLAKRIIEEHDPKSVDDMQDAYSGVSGQVFRNT